MLAGANASNGWLCDGCTVALINHSILSGQHFHANALQGTNPAERSIKGHSTATATGC